MLGLLCSGPIKDPRDTNWGRWQEGARGSLPGWDWEKDPRQMLSLHQRGNLWAAFNRAPRDGPAGSVLVLSGVSERRRRTQCAPNLLSHQDFVEPYHPCALAHAQAAASLCASLFPLLRSSYLESCGGGPSMESGWLQDLCHVP